MGRADRRLGEGSVKLIEIPTKEEVHDNIASFWQPKSALQAKGEHTYTYRLHWGPDTPKPTALVRFSRTGIGARGDNATLFVMDLIGDRGNIVDALKLALPADFQIAVLDINIGGDRIEPVAEIIDGRHLPFIFASGYGAAGLPEKFRDRPVLQKPFPLGSLGEAIERALG